MKKLYFLISLSLFIFIEQTKSQTLQQIGYYSINGISAMSSKAGYMQLGDGSIINISTPALPTLTGNLSLNGFSSSVLTEGNYTYYGTGMSVKLVIADITTPSFPLQVGYRLFPQSSGGIFGMAKQNDMLFLAMGSDGIFSVDVSNKATPIAKDSIIIPNGQARDIVIQGNYAYVAHGDGLKIIDISNPTNLTFITSIGSGYNSIDINNNFVFLGKNSGGIDVFNITNPTSPTPAFSIPNSGGTAWDVKYSNNHIYLATNSSGLFIYKIVNNSGLQKANFPNTNNGQSFAVSVQDSLILLSGLINGVAILKYDSLGVLGINDQEALEQINIFPNPASSYIQLNNTTNETFLEVDIADISGKTVLKPIYNNSTNRIDISALPQGTYILSLKNKKRISRKKIIKID